ARAWLDGRPFAPSALPQQLAGNLFPQGDVFQPDGYTREEDKLRDETRKILALPALPGEATGVRVPVERCHTEWVAVHLQPPLARGAGGALLAGAPGVGLGDEPARQRYPMPLPMSGRDEVAVGRIRQSRVFDPGLAFWLSGDQLRKGASLNAVQ